MHTDHMALTAGDPPRSAGWWLRRATMAGSLFFLVKGLAWLVAGYWLLAN
jgi:hypothetical protein